MRVIKLKTIPQAVVTTFAIIGCQFDETSQASIASSKSKNAMPFITANSIKRRFLVFLLVVLKTHVVLAQKLKIVARAKAIALATAERATSSEIGKKCRAMAKIVQLIMVLVTPTMKNLASCWKIWVCLSRWSSPQPQATSRSMKSSLAFFVMYIIIAPKKTVLPLFLWIKYDIIKVMMRLGEVWDYFMRRKLLLLSVIVASAVVVFLSCRLCFGRADEVTETVTPEFDEVAEIEVPKTGEVADIVEVGCDTGAVDWPEIALGNGENLPGDAESPESDSGITFWGAEAPTAMIRVEEIDAKTGEKIESVIITVGILAEIATLGAGKIIFDRYVR